MVKQIDLEPRKHSHQIEVVKTPKRLFFMVLAIWVALSAGMLAIGLPWYAVVYGAFGVVVGMVWVGAFPEYHMRRIRD